MSCSEPDTLHLTRPKVCGSCTMVINGHVRQACSALTQPPGRVERAPWLTIPP